MSFSHTKNLALWLALASLGLVLLAAPVRQTSATLFQNIARDMARNRVLHILRHYPDLLNEIIQQQQMMQMQQQGMNPNMQQQQNGLNGMNGMNGLNGQGGMNQPYGANNNLNGGQMAVQTSNLPNMNNGRPLGLAQQQGRPTVNPQLGIIV